MIRRGNWIRTSKAIKRIAAVAAMVPTTLLYLESAWLPAARLAACLPTSGDLTRTRALTTFHWRSWSTIIILRCRFFPNSHGDLGSCARADLLFFRCHPKLVFTLSVSVYSSHYHRNNSSWMGEYFKQNYCLKMKEKLILGYFLFTEKGSELNSTI